MAKRDGQGKAKRQRGTHRRRQRGTHRRRQRGGDRTTQRDRDKATQGDRDKVTLGDVETLRREIDRYRQTHTHTQTSRPSRTAPVATSAGITQGIRQTLYKTVKRNMWFQIQLQNTSFL